MHEELGDTNVSQRNNTGSQEISEGGIFTVNSQATTMNQAKFLFDTKKETDSDIVMLANTEKFILRCYLDTVEMVVRYNIFLFLDSNLTTAWEKCLFLLEIKLTV